MVRHEIRLKELFIAGRLKGNIPTISKLIIVVQFSRTISNIQINQVIKTITSDTTRYQSSTP